MAGMDSKGNAKGATVPIDPNGDLTLIVGIDDEARTFCVSSNAMRLASPVWRAMLSPQNGFKEATSGEITFPDDDPQALLVVLLACHLRFQDIPEQLKFTDLVNLCVLCDKYDCVTLLRPWLSAWMASWKSSVGKTGYEGWVFIAWVVGDEEVFECAVDRMVYTCKTDASKQCMDECGKLVDPLPYGLADAILAARFNVIKGLIEACHSILNTYLNTATTGPACKTPVSRRECDALVLGSLVHPLQKHLIWPGEPNQIACQATSSVQHYMAIINGITCYTYPYDEKHFRLNPSIARHEGCNFTLELCTMAVDVLKNKAAGILESNRRHLEIQRQKVGPSMMPLRLGQETEEL